MKFMTDEDYSTLLNKSILIRMIGMILSVSVAYILELFEFHKLICALSLILIMSVFLCVENKFRNRVDDELSRLNSYNKELKYTLKC